jgi:hypothetical protein
LPGGLSPCGEDGIKSLFFCSLIAWFFSPAFLTGQSPEREKLDWVIQALNERSLPFEERSLLADYGGFGSSLLARFPGEGDDYAEGTFVFAVPLGAEFAVRTALALCEIAGAEKNSQEILVAFLGDEENELPGDLGGISHKGLRDLLSLADMPENWVLCYLDAEEAPGELVIRHGIRGYIAPLGVVKPLPALFEDHRIPWSFRIRYNEIYKMGLVEGPEALFIAWAQEINGFVLSEGRKAKGPENPVSPENLAELLFNYAGTLELPVLSADRHYSFFSFPKSGGFFVSERFTAFVLLIMAGIFLFLFLIYSARYYVSMLFHINLFFRHLWICFIFLPLLAISIQGAGIFYSLLLTFFDVPRTGANYAGAGLTVLLAMLIFFLPSPVLNFIRFPRRANFYGFSALVFVIMGMFTAAFLDFSYVPVFLWAFFFVFLGASVSRPRLVFLCALASPLFAGGALLNIFETHSGRIAELFISSQWNSPGSWYAAFQTALLSLPFFLLIKRGTILIQKAASRGVEIKPDRKYRLIIIPLSIVLVLGTMVIQIRRLPKSIIVPERRFIVETSGGENDGKSAGILKVSSEDITFQDSRIITLRLEAQGNPARFDVSLESEGGESLLPVYSAPVPFDRGSEGRRINFILGERPPNPLTLEIVLPRNFTGLLRTQALYAAWNPALDSGVEPASDDYVLRVTRDIVLTTSGIQE